MTKSLIVWGKRSLGLLYLEATLSFLGAQTLDLN
jgi:hypothetical protein